jgi:hypothetical protein
MVCSSPSTIGEEKTDQAGDYADLTSTVTANASGTARHLGITTTSA